MLIFKRVADLQSWVARQRQAGRTIGFAPTMGALHAGHLELVHQASAAGDLAIASIFVNPTQFNDPKDLEKYPRTPELDLRLLHDAGCDAVFMPAVEEVYPAGFDKGLELDFGPLVEVMEGIFRPGHFDGMATVVKRLLDIVQPQRLYMGQKDFQQLTIVRSMLRQLQLPIELVMVATMREADGLAMSSRNLRLSPDSRTAAPAIYRILERAKNDFAQGRPAGEVEKAALHELEAAGLRPEYFEFADAITLQPVERYTDGDFLVVCTAAWAGDVRLIDNVIVKNG
jgi:pantoate--beta-alanine ligase